ncbi:MAG: tRNA pseudouridine(38-40) synthase TruA [Lachnospiraceae bacterium]|nr:tRNA pseudouridine(38-40) synthase TruA [Lachnospiraceae bacterium]
MKRILLTVAYDGTGYSGFQAQKSGVPTIERELNRALTELTGVETEVSGASRTDAGVHALCNLAVFDTESRIPPEKFANALNVRLPEQICVQNSKEVPADFHPRFCDTVKTYDYVIYNAPFPSPRKKRYTHYSYTPFDVEKMREAAQYLVGEHDFKSFCSIHTQAQTTTRTITEIEVIERPCEAEQTAERVAAMIPPFDMDNDSGTDPGPARRTVSPREIVIRVSGTGFLYNMVRIIAGTLMEAGRGALAPEQIKVILNACDRSKAGPTAPPEGLTLVRYRILNGNSDKNMKKINN